MIFLEGIGELKDIYLVGIVIVGILGIGYIGGGNSFT